jgi:riboflavin synthase
MEREEIAVWLTVGAAPEILRYMVPKGSITVDGISLTVVDVGPDRFQVSLIPHTVAMTNMQHHKVGETVNLEVDILAKYVERLLSGAPAHTAARRTGGGITESFLKEHGF